MADPRATARQWLADTMCADLDIDLDKPSCRRCLEKADAIVSAPGVEVREEVPGFDVEPGHRVPMYRVVTIRLPVQPIGEVLVDDRCPPDTIFLIGQPKDASEEPDPDRRWHGRAAVIRLPAEGGP